MRHSRSEAFRQALGEATAARQARHWSSVAADPNDPAALANRAGVLRAAWRPAISDRIAFLEDRSRGRRVLDIGCVAHDVARMRSPLWLHARLAAVSETILGVDVLEEGVKQMRALGYDAIAHDLGTGLGEVASYAPFDVIVAGELIEHVENVRMLFDVAESTLAADGELIVTTPNPYAPHRVRAAQLGIVWENVDHIFYAFPSGMAELAQRHGLHLSEAAVTASMPGTGSLAGALRSVRRRLVGRQWATVGYASIGRLRVRQVDYGWLGRTLHGLTLPGRRLTGETFIYVLRRS